MTDALVGVRYSHRPGSCSRRLSSHFRSQPCLLEVHKATHAKRMKIIPLRCEEPFSFRSRCQTRKRSGRTLDQTTRLLDEVQSPLRLSSIGLTRCPHVMGSSSTKRIT